MLDAIVLSVIILAFVILSANRVAWKVRALKAESIASANKPRLGPYREAAEAPAPAALPPPPPPPLILAWSAFNGAGENNTFKPAVKCPRCDRGWWLIEKLCSCADCNGRPHFHLECGGKGHEAEVRELGRCGAQWIMRSRETLQDTKGRLGTQSTGPG